MGQLAVIGVEINNNQALSGGVDLGNATLFAIEIPATWAGTSLTFQSKANRGNEELDNMETWKNVYDDEGNEVTVTVAANRIVTINAAALKLGALRFLRVRSGTSAAPINQSPSKQIQIIVKK